MRLAELALLRFGPFTDLRLDFAAGNGDLQLIYGTNEAGKSTLRRAVSALLFGVPETTRDDHLHRKPDLRIGARLEAADGTALSIVRRKGRKDTLLDAEERPIDDRLLLRWLGGVNREAFEALFGLSHETLVRGGEALLAGRGELAESLFGAGLGVRDLHARRRDLQTRAEAVFKPGGQKPPLNRALRDFQEARRESQQLALRPRDWQALQDRCSEAQNALTTARRARDEAAAEVARLQRRQRVLPAIGRRTQLLARREALGHVPALPTAAARERFDALRRLEQAQRQGRKLQDEVTRLQSERAGLQIPEALLERAAAIEGLRDPLGAYRKAQQDLSGLEAQATLAREHAADELRDLGRAPDLDQAAGLLVDAAAQARVRRLGQRHAGLVADLTAARKAVANQQRHQQALEAEQHRLPAPRDPEPLRQALAQARRRGDLDQQVTEAGESVAVLEAEAQQRRTALGLWEGPLAATRSLPLPPKPALERFARLFHELQDERRRVDEQRGETQQRLEQIDTEVGELKAGGAVPVEQDLEALREQRDTLWREIRARWLAGKTGPATSEALANDYQQLAAEADRLADRLWRDADRTARYGQLLRERERLDAKRAGQQQLLAGNAERQRQVQAEWRELWGPAGIDPLPPAEMQAWTERYERLGELAGRLADEQGRLAALQTEHRAQRARIGRELINLEESPALETESLCDLLARAEQVLAVLDETDGDRRRLRRDLEQLADERQAANAAAQDGADAMAEWTRQWAEAVGPLGLDANASVEEAEAMLAGLDRLFDHLRQERDYRRRIDQIKADAREFAARVAALAKACAMDLAGTLPDLAAEQLLGRLDAARADRRRRDELDDRLAANAAERTGLKRDTEAAQAVLARLMEQAGCGDLDCLEAAEQRAEELRAITASLQEVEQGLAGEGLPLERLVEEVYDTHPDRLPGQLEEAEARHRKHAEACDDLSETLGKLRTQLDAMDGGQQAADAAGRAQEALAEIRDHLARYARLRLAGFVLQRAMERYREANQAPLLRRVGDMFQVMTLGSFQGLTTGFDERDEAVLQCLAANGDTLGVEGLSEGTRDQLYLALRLASLERHVGANEPLPLIVDDLLVNFDDRRAAATLRLLGELSKRTQVLFFTHHSRLRDLAREAVPREQLREHDMAELADARADGRRPEAS